VTFIDRSTRWIEAAPVNSITAEAVAFAFCVNLGFAFWRTASAGDGPRPSIRIGSLFQQLATILGFQRLRTTAYHPQSNGLVERSHRTLKAALRAASLSRQDWTTNLPAVLLGMRTTPQSNNMSCFEMCTGATACMPTCVFQTPPTDMTNAQLRQLSTALQQHVVVPRQPDPAAKIRDDGHLLEGATHVWLRIDRIRRPLEAPYEGPYEVIERFPRFYRLRRLNGHTFTVSIDRQKTVPPTEETHEEGFLQVASVGGEVFLALHNSVFVGGLSVVI
jgi:cleavage and polyadenylation specificity factor subunit 1